MVKIVKTAVRENDAFYYKDFKLSVQSLIVRIDIDSHYRKVMERTKMGES
jgi:hypothetical protein